MDRYTAEMYELFKEAKIQNEQAYYEMHEQFEQRRKLRQNCKPSRLNYLHSIFNRRKI